MPHGGSCLSCTSHFLRAQFARNLLVYIVTGSHTFLLPLFSTTVYSLKSSLFFIFSNKCEKVPHTKLFYYDHDNYYWNKKLIKTNLLSKILEKYYSFRKLFCFLKLFAQIHNLFQKYMNILKMQTLLASIPAKSPGLAETLLFWEDNSQNDHQLPQTSLFEQNRSNIFCFAQ